MSHVFCIRCTRKTKEIKLNIWLCVVCDIRFKHVKLDDTMTYSTKEKIIVEMDLIKNILRSLHLDRRIRKIYEEELEELNYRLCQLDN